MQEPPYDRSFALSAQVLAMKDHYLEVACECGARRVIGFGSMEKKPHIRTMTLATVAAKVHCLVDPVVGAGIRGQLPAPAASRASHRARI
jgi:hypothetical protein